MKNTQKEIQDNPFTGPVIPLYRNGAVVHYAMVSPQDYARISLHRWGFIEGRKTPYACRHERIKGTRSGNRIVYMHREILGLPVGGGHAIEADHLNYNGLDNRRENLRVVTRGEQMARRRCFSKKDTKTVGVYPPAGRSHLWTANVFRNGKYIHRSSHKTQGEAIAARNEALAKYEAMAQQVNA